MKKHELSLASCLRTRAEKYNILFFCLLFLKYIEGGLFFFIYIFTHLKQKITITRYENINVPGIQVKKRLEQRMLINEIIC